MIASMHTPLGFFNVRSRPAQAGASVLAALVLVAILGAVLLIFQYVRSSADFSYEPSTLLAAASGAGSTAACDYKTQSCPCTSDKTTPSAGVTDQQCLPGCQYRVTNNAGTSATPLVESVGTPNTSTDPKSWPGGTPPPGYLQFCGVTGACSKQIQCQAGGSLSAAQLSQIQAQSGVQAIVSAATPAAAAQQVSLYTTQGGDLGYLSADLSPTSGAPGTVAQQTTNIDAANTQIESLSVASDPVQAAQTSLNVNSDLSNPTDVTNIQDPEIAAQQQQLHQQDVAQDAQQDAADNAGTDCKAAGCVDSNTNNYGSGDTFQGPCPSGQVQTSTGCGAAPAAPAANPVPAPAAPVVAPAAKSTSLLSSLFGSNNSALSTGLSFLTGLAKGYSQSLQNQQIAQQIQAAQTAQQQAYAPYGVGTDGLSCPQPQQQPSASQCTVGTWQQLYQTNQCPSTWQCVPTNTGATAVQPSANISCQPQTADVGMNISISYSCANATDSTGGGFSTNDQLSGSATAAIANPPAGTNTATYGITCINQSQVQSQAQPLTASAQCAVQINQPSIVLIANPSVVATSSTTAIGWVTSGMSSCTISSPDSAAFTAANAGNTSINGVATTPPLTAPMRAVLTCQTVGGSTKTAVTTVTLGGSGSNAASSAAPLSVTSSADNGSAAHGGTITINWSSVNPPTGSAMSLWLVNKQTKTANAIIAGGLAVNGVYTWNVPSVGATCNPNASNACASDLVEGDSYAVEAVMYSPASAYVGDGTAPSDPVAPVYGQSAVSGTFTLEDNASGGE